MPKNGFGGPEGVGLDSAVLGFGEDVEAAPLPVLDELAGNEFLCNVTVSNASVYTQEGDVTLLMGLNDEAFTFRRFPPGDRGVFCPTLPFCGVIDEVRMGAGGCAAPLPEGGEVRLPLNGGMG